LALSLVFLFTFLFHDFYLNSEGKVCPFSFALMQKKQKIKAAFFLLKS